MREEITYYAEDGTKFTNKQECLDYENKLNIVKSWTMEDINKIYKTLALIKEYCKHCSDCSRSCPFECICEECVDSWKIPNIEEDIKKADKEVKNFEIAFKEVTTPSYWIQVESDKDENNFYCSNCGHLHRGSDISKYCDFCGSIMEDGCVTIPICSCYDKSERCNGTRERDYVTCKGDRMNCKIYDYIPEKALKEANDVHYEKQREHKSASYSGDNNAYINLESVHNPIVDSYYIYISENEVGKHNLATTHIGKFLSYFQDTFTVQNYSDLITSTYAWRRKTGKYFDWDLYPLHMFNICKFEIGIYIYLHNDEDRNILSQYIYNMDDWKETLNKYRDCVVCIMNNKIVAADNLISYSFTGSPKLIWRVDKHGFLYSLDVMEYLNAPHIKHICKDIPYVINTENQCIYKVTQLSAPKTYRLDILPNHGEESIYIYNDTPLVKSYVPLNLVEIEIYGINIVLHCDKQETVKRVLEYWDLIPTTSDLTVYIENGKVKEPVNASIFTNFLRFNVCVNKDNELEFTYAVSYE